ncbi:MAG: hypothetical protein ACI9CQ_001998, partial [Saprospiraceae bacterium]
SVLSTAKLYPTEQLQLFYKSIRRMNLQTLLIINPYAETLSFAIIAFEL